MPLGERLALGFDVLITFALDPNRFFQAGVVRYDRETKLSVDQITLQNPVHHGVRRCDSHPSEAIHHPDAKRLERDISSFVGKRIESSFESLFEFLLRRCDADDDRIGAKADHRENDERHHHFDKREACRGVLKSWGSRFHHCLHRLYCRDAQADNATKNLAVSDEPRAVGALILVHGEQCSAEPAATFSDQLHLRDGLKLHIGGSFVDLADFGITPELFDGILFREAISAVKIDCK